MLKDLVGKYYLDQNYNCAESVLRAGNEYYDLGLHDRDMIVVAAYGGGIQSGNTCGAVLAGAGILSMKYVEQKSHDSKDIRPVVLKLIQQFNKAYGSVLCKDIKPQSFKPEYRCQKTVETACDILEAVIAYYEREKKEQNF